jgi:Family of unknown function (DUF6522)
MAGRAPYEGTRRAGSRSESIMINPSPPVIATRGDDVTVEASYLAGQLGLSLDRLRAEMRRGVVYSTVERGMGEDAGRLRLTVRYRARVWTVVVRCEDSEPAAAPRNGPAARS